MSRAKEDYKNQVPVGQQSEEHFKAWLDNAVKAGVYNPNGSPRQATGSGSAAHTDTADYSGGTDTTGMRAYAREHGMSEDYARFDDATLNLWEQYKDSNCPPTHPYQSINGTGCAEKPIDSGLDSPGKQGRGMGGGGAQKGAQQQKWGPQQPVNPLFNINNPLQNNLVKMFQQGGMFNQMTGDPSGQNILARGIQGGGVWWADQNALNNPFANPNQQAVNQQVKSHVPANMRAYNEKIRNQNAAMAPAPVATPAGPAPPLQQGLMNMFKSAPKPWMGFGGKMKM